MTVWMKIQINFNSGGYRVNTILPNSKTNMIDSQYINTSEIFFITKVKCQYNLTYKKTKLLGWGMSFLILEDQLTVPIMVFKITVNSL